MSIEDQIREKHRCEDEAKQLAEQRAWQLELFRRVVSKIHDFARAMSERELEIVMARLADRLTDTRGDIPRFSLRVKGMVFKAELDLRTAGVAKLDEKMRSQFDSANSWEFKWKQEPTNEYLWRTLLAQDVPLPAPESNLSNWSQEFGLAEIQNCLCKFYQKK